MNTKFEWNPEIHNIQKETPANSANSANQADSIKDMQCEHCANPCESADTQSTNQQRFADIRNRFAINNHNTINEVRNIRKIRNPDNCVEKNLQYVGDGMFNSGELIPPSEAVREIARVMKRLSSIWTNKLKPDFDLQDQVDFTAMTGTRSEFQKVIQEWEDRETTRAIEWKKGQINE